MVKFSFLSWVYRLRLSEEPNIATSVIILDHITCSLKFFTSIMFRFIKIHRISMQAIMNTPRIRRIILPRLPILDILICHFAFTDLSHIMDCINISTQTIINEDVQTKCCYKTIDYCLFILFKKALMQRVCTRQSKIIIYLRHKRSHYIFPS